MLVGEAAQYIFLGFFVGAVSFSIASYCSLEMWF
jgi:hypothetical protein